MPIAYSGAAAASHVLRAFVSESAGVRRLTAAVLLDMALLNAYFAGRLVGISILLTDAPSQSACSRS